MIHQVNSAKEFKEVMKRNTQNEVEIQWGKAYYKFYPVFRTSEIQKKIAENYLKTSKYSEDEKQRVYALIHKKMFGRVNSKGQKQYRDFTADEYTQMRAKAVQKLNK